MVENEICRGISKKGIINYAITVLRGCYGIPMRHIDMNFFSDGIVSYCAKLPIARKLVNIRTDDLLMYTTQYLLMLYLAKHKQKMPRKLKKRIFRNKKLIK